MADDDDSEQAKEPEPADDERSEAPPAKSEEAAEAAPKKAAPARRRRRTTLKKAAPEEAPIAKTAEPSDMVALPPVTVADERKARRTLGTGALVGALGLALVGTGPSEAGTIICVAGLLVLIYGIHTFGRLGPEPAK